MRKELLEIGYFLSRMGISAPPAQLQVSSWKEAYLSFYKFHGESQTKTSFRNSLKNIRDAFDGYHQNNRVGWKEPDGSPINLGKEKEEVFNELSMKSDSELWQLVKKHKTSVLPKNTIHSQFKNNLRLNKYTPEFTGLKKGYSITISDINSEHGAVVDALKNYCEKNIPGIIFNDSLIDLAIELSGETTHIFEVKTGTNTQQMYTAVGQLFVHGVGHDNAVKFLVIPNKLFTSNLRNKILALGIKIIQYRYTTDQTISFEQLEPSLSL